MLGNQHRLAEALQDFRGVLALFVVPFFMLVCLPCSNQPAFCPMGFKFMAHGHIPFLQTAEGEQGHLFGSTPWNGRGQRLPSSHSRRG